MVNNTYHITVVCANFYSSRAKFLTQRRGVYETV